MLRGILAVIARVFGQMAGARRDLERKRYELRVDGLIEAWRSLERAARRGGDMQALQNALADVQLFGSPEQVSRASAVAAALTRDIADEALLGVLLEELRFDLREELGIARARGPVVHLRAAA
jgi:hypothetical protein